MTASTLFSCESLQIMLPSVTMYCTLSQYPINPQQLQFGARQNPLLPCQHLHPSAIRTNVIILEMTITIIKTAKCA